MKLTEQRLRKLAGLPLMEQDDRKLLQWLDKNLEEFGDGINRSPKYWDAKWFYLKADFKASAKIETDFDKLRDKIRSSNLPQEEDDDAIDKSVEDETKAGAKFTKARKGKLMFNGFDSRNQMTIVLSAAGLKTRDLEKWWQEGFVPGVQKKFPGITPKITKVKIDNSGAFDQGDGPLVLNNTAFDVTWTV